MPSPPGPPVSTPTHSQCRKLIQYIALLLLTFWNSTSGKISGLTCLTCDIEINRAAGPAAITVGISLMPYCALLLFILYKRHSSKLVGDCSSRYVGEGMAASITGLAVGVVLLALRETSILSAELAQALLTFNHTNFFV